MTLSEAAKALNLPAPQQDVRFTRVSTDSRSIMPGDFFVALRGDRFDGHEYIQTAISQGAVAALVEKPEFAASCPVLVVGNSRLALGKLANYWRRKFPIKFAAITGSNGKTTVKEMLASILREIPGESETSVLSTKGNLNNEIGVPLTLFELTEKTRYAVIELGMNHPKEISYLTRLVEPDVALINNAHFAHLEGLKSVEAVASAKGEIFEGLRTDGVAVINADDQFATFWKNLAKGKKQLTFGLENKADVNATYELGVYESSVRVKNPSIEFRLKVPGMHNVRNSLASLTLAMAMGADSVAITRGLEKFSGVKGRLQKKSASGNAALIDDTYNANPDSVKAAIKVLARSMGKKILVLGDMGELGVQGEELHKEIGIFAKEAGIDWLYAVGTLTLFSVKNFGATGKYFSSIEDLVGDLKPQLDANTNVLVKGSRFMQMERIVEALSQKQTQHVTEDH